MILVLDFFILFTTITHSPQSDVDAFMVDRLLESGSAGVPPRKFLFHVF